MEKAECQPLSWPLFIYVNARSAQTKPQIKNFIAFYIKQVPTLVRFVGYVLLPAEGYYLHSVHFVTGRMGKVFGGEAQLNLAIGEVEKTM